MLVELDSIVNVTRPDGTLRVYNPGQPIYLTPDEAAQVLLQLHDVHIRVVSRLTPYPGLQASWKTPSGDLRSGLILLSFSYQAKEPMLLVLHDGKGIFVSTREAQIDPAPLLQATREAGLSALSDRGEIIATAVVSTVLDMLDAEAV